MIFRNKFIIQTHLPLLTDGSAMDVRFLESARVRQFLMAFSRLATALDWPHVGLFTWITYLAGKVCPGHMAAV